jgi:osmoprotectant transport system permease protein
MRRSDVKPRTQVLADVTHWMRQSHGIVTLGALGFENAYALAMPRERADALGIHSIADLAARAQTLSVAGDYEFFGRPEWAGLRDAYGLKFREQRQMQAEFMYPAVANGEADVIVAYTSDGRIAQYDLVVLDDPKHALPPYDAVLLISPRRANDQAFVEALKPLVGAIDVKTMREANRRAASNLSPQQAARWLWDEISKNR